MTLEPIHAARNQAGSAKAIHRPLHRRGVAKDIFTVRTFGYASHAKDRSTVLGALLSFHPVAQFLQIAGANGGSGRDGLWELHVGELHHAARFIEAVA